MTDESGPLVISFRICIANLTSKLQSEVQGMRIIDATISNYSELGCPYAELMEHRSSIYP